MPRKRSSEVTDWLWFGYCPVCETSPGHACLNQQERLTATIRGQSSITRPHDGREKLAERIVPFLSDDARATLPEMLAWLQAQVALADVPWAGEGSKARAEACQLVAWELGRAGTAVPTTRSNPYWPDRATADS